MDEVFLTKMDATDTYLSKFEASSNYQPKGDYVSTSTLNNYYTTGETESRLLKKQDSGDYVSASTLNNYYTKAETESRLFDKQNKLVSGQNIKTINGQSIVGEGNIVIENDTDLTDYYTKTQVDNKLSDKLDTTAYTRVIIDTELSNTSTNPVQNKAIAIKLAELETVIDDLKKKSDNIAKVTFMSVDYNGIELKPTYTVTYGNTTITTPNSELYVEKDVTMTVVPSDIGDLVTPDAQTKKISGSTTFNFEYNGEALPVGTGAISFRTASDNYTVNVVNDASKLTSMVIDNVTIPLAESGITNYTFANAGVHTGTYTLKGGVNDGYRDLFTNCDELVSVSIPNGVTTLVQTFDSCSKLNSVSLPTTLESIGSSAFWQCISLSSIVIPDSVTSIAENAFFTCSGLTSVIIGNGVTTIGSMAFSHCSGLTSVTLPDSVTSIGFQAFAGCSSLTAITVKATTPPTLGFGAIPPNNVTAIYVPSGSVKAYKKASGWSTYASVIQAIQE
jgi:hypothetical protein